MDLINTMTNVDGVWADTIIFFSVVVVMILGIILSVDDLTLQDGISKVRRNKLLGHSTIRCIAETPIIFIVVAVVDLALGFLSIYVFDKSTNMALSIIVLCPILCLVVLIVACCVVVAPISKIVYYCRIIVGKPNTLAGYYAYRMMQVYPTTITTKHFDFDIYRFDKEQFNKRLADGAKLADSMNESSSLEDKLRCIDNIIDYSMYH